MRVIGGEWEGPRGLDPPLLPFSSGLGGGAGSQLYVKEALSWWLIGVCHRAQLSLSPQEETMAEPPRRRRGGRNPAGVGTCQCQLPIRGAFHRQTFFFFS